jgi:CBS domain-containing protein
MRARDIMTQGVECIGEERTVLEAARRLAELDVGALPIVAADGRISGMLTDRDIVVKVLARGKDPAATTAGELAGGRPTIVRADDSIQDAMQLMIDHKVRRLPVLDGDHLVGIISQGDIARHVEEEDTGRLVEIISTAPASD